LHPAPEFYEKNSRKIYDSWYSMTTNSPKLSDGNSTFSGDLCDLYSENLKSIVKAQELYIPQLMFYAVKNGHLWGMHESLHQPRIFEILESLPSMHTHPT